uniref:Small ribosomal subunit protein uS2c n=1 Tax=Cynomorium coccineum TaxID=51503 RepID=A0A1B1FBV5_9MAGN|nr:ribosomal protein S2 [Cynomorium coccineum]
MTKINFKEILKAGISIDHDIFNITRTASFLSKTCDLVFYASSQGKILLMVGTKNKISNLVLKAAIKARCHYVNKKWICGMLTNWTITEAKLNRLRYLKNKKKESLINLQKYLSGVIYMTRPPDIVVILDQQNERKVIKECIYLGIPIICLINTNDNQNIINIPILSNNSIASIKFILNKLVLSICKGNYNYKKKNV